jgi:predicted transcriptional regulator
VKEVMMSSLEFKGLISRGVWRSKMVESVQVMTVLNERKGMVLFPNLKGKVDTNYAFFSKDPAFHEWCSDYFNYTWDHAGSYDVYKLR